MVVLVFSMLVVSVLNGQLLKKIGPVFPKLMILNSLNSYLLACTLSGVNVKPTGVIAIILI